MPTILLRGEPGDRPPRALLVESAEMAERVASLLGIDPAPPELIGDHRGLSAFRGWWHGHPVTIQTTGVGAPATAMVVEELLMLGAQRFVRVATAVGVAAEVIPGDVVVPIAASAADGTTRTYVHGAPMATAADFTLVDALTSGLAAKAPRVHQGSVATVDVVPDQTTITMWRSRGIVALEMGCAPLFYLCARYTAAIAPDPHRVTTAASVLVIGDALHERAAGLPTAEIIAEDVIAAALDALAAQHVRPGAPGLD